MRSWRARLLTLFTAVVMTLALSGPAAMAHVNFVDHHDDHIFDRNDILDDNCIGTTIFGHCTGVETNGGFFDNDDEDLDTIDVGRLECLVDEDRVLFCVNEDTGQRVFV